MKRFDIHELSTGRLLQADTSEQGARQCELNGCAGVPAGDVLAVDAGGGLEAVNAYRISVAPFLLGSICDGNFVADAFGSDSTFATAEDAEECARDLVAGVVWTEYSGDSSAPDYAVIRDERTEEIVARFSFDDLKG